MTHSTMTHSTVTWLAQRAVSLTPPPSPATPPSPPSPLMHLLLPLFTCRSHHAPATALVHLLQPSCTRYCLMIPACYCLLPYYGHGILGFWDSGRAASIYDKHLVRKCVRIFIISNFGQEMCTHFYYQQFCFELCHGVCAQHPPPYSCLPNLCPTHCTHADIILLKPWPHTYIPPRAYTL